MAYKSVKKIIFYGDNKISFKMRWNRPWNVNELPFHSKNPIFCVSRFFSSHFVAWKCEKSWSENEKKTIHHIENNNIGLYTIDAPFLFTQVNSTSLFQSVHVEKKINDNEKVTVYTDSWSIWYAFFVLRAENSMEQKCMINAQRQYNRINITRCGFKCRNGFFSVMFCVFPFSYIYVSHHSLRTQYPPIINLLQIRIVFNFQKKKKNSPICIICSIWSVDIWSEPNGGHLLIFDGTSVI